jgi:hypothetical protein
MPADKSTITFDVADCKVYPITADTAVGITYGAAVDVPGIQEVTVEANFVTAELKGDGGKVLAKKGKIDRLNFSATYSELSLDVMATIFGGSITAAGSGTSETQSYTFNSRSLPYFKVEFLIDDIEAGLSEIAMVLDKCQVTGGSIMGGSTDNFSQPTFDAEAILSAYTGAFGTVQFRETGSGLSA